MPIDTDENGLQAKTSLICDPIFDPEFVAFVQDESFRGQSSGPRPSSLYTTMPMLLADEENNLTHTQQFVSESLMSQALEAFYDDGLLVLNRTVSSELLTQFFENFEKVFGKHDAVKVQVTSLEIPKLDIDYAGSRLSAKI